MCRHNKEVMLHRFLDWVETQGGQLLILGDLLELWRFDIEEIVTYWEPLFDRLNDLGTKIIPGNHDPLNPDDPTMTHLHPAFQNVVHSYVQRIGEQRFCFMHGHEVDPFIPQRLDIWGQRLGAWAGWLEFNSDLCLTVCDPVVDVLLELGEQAVHCWQWITRNVNHRLHDELAFLSCSGLNRFKRGLRSRKMLSRFCQQRDHGDYDVAVVGHTHRAGSFNQWYFNSGSWTKQVPNFLKIWPDGHVEVFDWDGRHEQSHQSPVIRSNR